METEPSSILQQAFTNTSQTNSPVSAIDSLDKSKDGEQVNESNNGALDVREKRHSYERNHLSGKYKIFVSPRNPLATNISEKSCDDELDFEDKFYEKKISKQSFDQHGIGNVQNEKDSDSAGGEKETVLDNELKPEKENGGNSKAEFEEGCRSEGELSDEDNDLQEGEVKDASPSPEQPAPKICTLFKLGKCTWGLNCTNMHQRPGDKDNYNMFSPKLVSSSQLELPQHRGMGFRIPIGKRGLPPWHDLDLPSPEIPLFQFPGVPREQSMDFYWERALKKTKELMKKANNRKKQGQNFVEKQANLNGDGSDSSYVESDKKNEVSTESPCQKQTRVYNRYDQQKVKDNSYRYSTERERCEDLKKRRGKQCENNNRTEGTLFTRKLFEPLKPNGSFRPKERWRDEQLSEIKIKTAESSERNEPWWRSRAVKPSRNRLRSKSRISGSYSESRSSGKSTRKKLKSRPLPYKRRQRSSRSRSISCSSSSRSASKSPPRQWSAPKSTKGQRSAFKSRPRQRCRHRSFSKSQLQSRSAYKSPSRSLSRAGSLSVSSVGSHEGNDACYKDNRGSKEKRQGRSSEDFLATRWKADARQKALNDEVRPRNSRKPLRGNRTPQTRTTKTRANKCSDRKRTRTPDFTKRSPRFRFSDSQSSVSSYSDRESPERSNRNLSRNADRVSQKLQNKKSLPLPYNEITALLFAAVLNNYRKRSRRPTLRSRSRNSASNSTSSSRSRSVSSASESGRSHSSSGSEHSHAPKTRVPPAKFLQTRARVYKTGLKISRIQKPVLKHSPPSLCNEIERLMQYDKLRDKTDSSAVAGSWGNSPRLSVQEMNVREQSLPTDKSNPAVTEKSKDSSKQKGQSRLNSSNKTSNPSRNSTERSEMQSREEGRTLKGASRGTKRPLSPSSERNNSATKRPNCSQKEILLKHLKAVEDAIARKKPKKTELKIFPHMYAPIHCRNASTEEMSISNNAIKKYCA